ncbi:hypothetical protein JM47_00185 [Ureaplasma diversum]|uniref:Immunoglobulin-blocking virulence protein n=1 Tax=Ureaplasma diversum TaxID=42094 RepID=A0A0C5RNN6_9BACT|nr:putative immunoglobulin-blocking virulence protein [Ureaplasma diversum]AJQ45089.1 hypothetical protein JM47_00185 [Ureaplasma diversum]
MKLATKIVIGISVATSIAATSIALGVAFGSKGLDDNITAKTVIYKTENAEGKPIEKKEAIPEKIEPKKTPTPAQPEVIEPDKQEEIKKEPEPKPDVQEAPEAAPEPVPQPEPEPKELKPTDRPDEPEPPIEPFKLPDQEYREVEVNGIKVRVKVQPQPKRQIFQSDVDHRLLNDDPYISELVPDVLSVEVTEEFRQKSFTHTTSALKYITGQDHTGFSKDFKTHDEKELTELLNQQYESIWRDRFYKFSRLFDNGDAVKPFLTEEGQKLYPAWTIEAFKEKLLKTQPNRRVYDSDSSYEERKKEWIRNVDKHAKNLRYAKLFAYLDTSKFKKYTANAEEQLKKGLIPDETNVYINADGSVDSHAYSPLPGYNKVTTRMERDNKDRRAYGYPSWRILSPDEIQKGEYPGWTSTDVTNSAEFKKYTEKAKGGITIKEMKRDKPSDDPKHLNFGYTVTFDFSNDEAYKQAADLIRQLQKDGKKITSYRFMNVGKKNANQRMLDILKALPDEMPQVHIFFESQNTSGLNGLKNKKIKELALYTSTNPLLEEWSINPLVLKGVRWVNDVDYNVSADFSRNARKISRVVFNSISFDQEDIDEKQEKYRDKMLEINRGLRMAYWTRNNEKIFQGSFGPGLKPDHNEGGSSYPTGLDLTRTNLKSLWGFYFADAKKPENGKRKLLRLVLKNEGSDFSIDVEELNNAQFDVLDMNPLQPAKIKFSNGTATTHIRITNKKNLKIDGNGAFNLNVLKQAGKDNFGTNPIRIDNGQTQLRDQLTGYGYSIEEGDSLEIT